MRLRRLCGNIGSSFFIFIYERRFTHYELTKTHGIRIIHAMKRGTPALETEKGVVQFYSKTQIERHGLFGKKFSKLFNFPIECHADTVGREMDHTEFHGSFLEYILEKEKE